MNDALRQSALALMRELDGLQDELRRRGFLSRAPEHKPEADSGRGRRSGDGRIPGPLPVGGEPKGHQYYPAKALGRRIRLPDGSVGLVVLGPQDTLDELKLRTGHLVEWEQSPGNAVGDLEPVLGRDQDV